MGWWSRSQWAVTVSKKKKRMEERMPTDSFEQRRQGLEDEFFADRERELVEKLRKTLTVEQRREELRTISGIADEKVIDTLMEMHLNGDTFAAFGLFPLVEVAWADGKVDDREREAFLTAAAEQGITPGSPGHDALRIFIEEAPREDARKAWLAWAEAVSAKLAPAERREVREGLVKRARTIAEASGSILGFTNPVSANEERVIARIEKAFAD